jgi:hypothetical protein
MKHVNTVCGQTAVFLMLKKVIHSVTCIARQQTSRHPFPANSFITFASFVAFPGKILQTRFIFSWVINLHHWRPSPAPLPWINYSLTKWQEINFYCPYGKGDNSVFQNSFWNVYPAKNNELLVGYKYSLKNRPSLNLQLRRGNMSLAREKY